MLAWCLAETRIRYQVRCTGRITTQLPLIGTDAIIECELDEAVGAWAGGGYKRLMRSARQRTEERDDHL
jgi:hypothetical protein